MQIEDSIEEKYGVFFVEDFIFRKEDFGMQSYRDNKEEKKKEKMEKFKNYKKYSIIKQI